QVRFRPSAEALFPELQGRPILQRAQIGKPSIEWNTAPLAHFSTSFSSLVKPRVSLRNSFLSRKRSQRRLSFSEESASQKSRICKQRPLIVCLIAASSNCAIRTSTGPLSDLPAS